MNQIGYTGNVDTTVTGISIEGAQGSNLIMGGDTSIFLNKNTDSGSMYTYGIFSRVYNENINNLIILKSANMEIYSHGNGAGIDFDHRISSGTSEVTLLNERDSVRAKPEEAEKDSADEKSDTDGGRL